MKKMISILLSVSMLLGTAAITTNAATVDESTVGTHNYSVVDTTTLKNGQVRFYTYNFTDNNPRMGIGMVDTTLNAQEDFYFNDINGYRQINVPVTSDIEHWFVFSCKRFSERTKFIKPFKRYDNTAGTYEKIRVKLSDYTKFFNSDGTHTENGFNYNFSTQKSGDSTYYSVLAFSSGGVFTAVTPDNDGYAELYISKNIGEQTLILTEFWLLTPTSSRGSDGANGRYFNYLTMGNANADNRINVDDVTAIQSNSAGIEDFDNLQKRNADVNFDGKINVDDATMVQKYLAGLI